MPAVAAAQDNGQRLLEQGNSAYRSLHASNAVDLYRRYLAAYPDRPDVRVFLGGALLNLDQPEAALNEAKHAIALDPAYAKGYILAGRIYAAREAWDAAQEFFEKAQHLDKRDIDGWYFSGRAYYDANRFELAIARFEEALRIDPAQSRLYENLALAQDGLGQSGAAEASFRKALDHANGAWRPYLAYGAFLFRQGRGADALPNLRQAFALAPDVVDVRFELARVLYQQDHSAEAAGILEPAVQSNECRVHNLMARIHSARGESGPADVEVRALEHCATAGARQ
jgi:tetratricopeptide (TPR) repeat protein